MVCDGFFVPSVMGTLGLGRLTAQLPEIITPNSSNFWLITKMFYGQI